MLGLWDAGAWPMPGKPRKYRGENYRDERACYGNECANRGPVIGIPEINEKWAKSEKVKQSLPRSRLHITAQWVMYPFLLCILFFSCVSVFAWSNCSGNKNRKSS